MRLILLDCSTVLCSVFWFLCLLTWCHFTVKETFLIRLTVSPSKVGIDLGELLWALPSACAVGLYSILFSKILLSFRGILGRNAQGLLLPGSAQGSLVLGSGFGRYCFPFPLGMVGPQACWNRSGCVSFHFLAVPSALRSCLPVQGE